GVIRSFGPAAEGDPGVRAVDVHAPIGGQGALNQLANSALNRDISDHRHATKLRGNRLRRVAIDVGDHHGGRAFLLETSAQGTTDSATPTRDDGDRALQLHARPTTATRPG